MTSISYLDAVHVVVIHANPQFTTWNYVVCSR